MIQEQSEEGNSLVVIYKSKEFTVLIKKDSRHSEIIKNIKKEIGVLNSGTIELRDGDGIKIQVNYEVKGPVYAKQKINIPFISDGYDGLI